MSIRKHFSLNGDLLGVQYSPKPVGVAIDYNGLMYITEWTTGKINVFNIDGTKSHVISIGGSAYLRKIQFNKQGNLYVGEHNNKAVYVLIDVAFLYEASMYQLHIWKVYILILMMTLLSMLLIVQKVLARY